MESWWPQSAWLSSGTAMFLFFNVLVGTVAILSRGQQGSQGRRLCRSASSMVLGRLRSFTSMFSVHPEVECYDYDYHTTPEAGELQVGKVAATETISGIDAVPSMQERKTNEVGEKCTSLSDERSVQDQQQHAPAQQLPLAASAAGEAIASVEEMATASKELPDMEAPQSSSKRRARACRREAEGALEGKAELNARAELFIQQFKEDLKLQRLNSIINYTRALQRRAGAALLPQE